MSSRPLRPDGSTHLRLEGILSRVWVVDDLPPLEDSFHLRIVIPRQFPKQPPVVYELDDKIPQEYHHLNGGALCLGAPIRVAFAVSRNPTLLTFVQSLLIPYLYGFCHYQKFGKEPWPGLGPGSRAFRLRPISAA